ncbi:hypothetical protein U1Q18_044215 [Sarracenia purpurea var. burkii]
MEPMESDSAKVKGEKLENEQNLGDAIGRDEVGDCSFEAVTAIPLAEVACLEACTEEKERSQMVIFGVVKGDLAGPRAGFMMLQLPEGFCFLDAAV